MKLTRVTITGADDGTDIKDLIEISKKYPFVEWGILFSPTRNLENQPRYPSHNWIREFLHYTANTKINKSAHLCGGYTSDFLETGKNTLIDKHFNLLGWFDRWQLNFNARKNIPHEDFIKWLATDNFISTRKPLILQLNENNRIVTNPIIAISRESEAFKGPARAVYPPFYHHIQFLYDASGGTGKTIEKIEPVMYGHLTGYAGGLNPENLQECLDKIVDAHKGSSIEPHVWVDTESGVRTPACNSALPNATVLDLDKVVKFLEIAKPYTL